LGLSFFPTHHPFKFLLRALNHDRTIISVWVHHHINAKTNAWSIMHDRVNTNKIGKSTFRTRDYWLRKHTFSIYAKDSIIMMDTCVVLMIYIHGTNTSDGASFPFRDIGVYTLHEYSFRDIGVYTLHEYLLIVTFFCFKLRSVS